jgi:CATRA-associated small protein
MSDAPDEEDVATILDILDQMAHWRQHPSRWDRVRSLLAEIDGAFTTVDRDAVRELTGELERSGPTRATRIGAEPTEPPPPDVLERRNHLVYRLTREQPVPPQRDRDRSEAGDGQRER